MSLTADLLAWYRAAARDLPWRRTRDPYAVWLSEVLLQQTQVATVTPYYERILAAFPTVEALAAAPLDDLLRLWQGLGYYRRARSLHQAARRVVDEFGGRLPDDPAVLRTLPGIGEYTAGAITSLCFDRPTPAIDGNVLRVISRLDAVTGDPARGAGRRAIREHVTELLDPAAPGEFNQALMELGATVCTPAAPRCGDCPWRAACRAAAEGQPTRYPETPARPAPRQRRHVCALLRDGAGRLLFAQRPTDGRWGGLWELPRVELELDDDPAAGLRRGLLAALGLRVTVGDRVAAVRYAISGEAIRLEAWTVAAEHGEPRPLGYQALTWVDEPADLALSTAQKRLLAALAQPELPGAAG